LHPTYTELCRLFWRRPLLVIFKGINHEASNNAKDTISLFFIFEKYRYIDKWSFKKAFFFDVISLKSIFIIIWLTPFLLIVISSFRLREDDRMMKNNEFRDVENTLSQISGLYKEFIKFISQASLIAFNVHCAFLMSTPNYNDLMFYCVLRNIKS
jgi:hypothetical protein